MDCISFVALFRTTETFSKAKWRIQAQQQKDLDYREIDSNPQLQKENYCSFKETTQFM
jgi:hypothetical protein